MTSVTLNVFDTHFADQTTTGTTFKACGCLFLGWLGNAHAHFFVFLICTHFEEFSCTVSMEVLWHRTHSQWEKANFSRVFSCLVVFHTARLRFRLVCTVRKAFLTTHSLIQILSLIDSHCKLLKVGIVVFQSNKVGHYSGANDFTFVSHPFSKRALISDQCYLKELGPNVQAI